jgi:hypothetical protein
MKLVLAGILGAVLSVGAFAEEAKVAGVEIDGKKIAIESSRGGDVPAIHSNELKDGVFIVAPTGPYSTKYYDNAAAIIRAEFAAAGLKIAGNAESSSIGIQFLTPSGALDMEDANKAAANSALPNSNQVISNAAGVAGAVINAGPLGGVAYLAGGLFGSSSKAGLLGGVMVKPVNDRMFKSRTPDATTIYYKTFVEYKLDKKDKASDDVVLKMMVRQWIKNCIVFDDVAASSVPATEQVKVVAQK